VASLNIFCNSYFAIIQTFEYMKITKDIALFKISIFNQNIWLFKRGWKTDIAESLSLKNLDGLSETSFKKLKKVLTKQTTFEKKFYLYFLKKPLKLSCNSRFQRAFTACICVLIVITLVWANQCKSFDKANACSKRTLKTHVENACRNTALGAIQVIRDTLGGGVYVCV